MFTSIYTSRGQPISPTHLAPFQCTCLLHRHWESYHENRYPFDRYEIAYTYGLSFAADEAYTEWKGSEIEERVRQGWEEKEAGPWEDFKEAIKYPWQTAKEAMSE